jgi:hypothetical protein
MPGLDDTTVAEGLQRLPGWERCGNQLVKTFVRADVARAMVFVNEVAAAAEAPATTPTSAPADLVLAQLRQSGSSGSLPATPSGRIAAWLVSSSQAVLKGICSWSSPASAPPPHTLAGWLASAVEVRSGRVSPGRLAAALHRDSGWPVCG